MKRIILAIVGAYLVGCSSSGGPKDLDHTLANQTGDSREKVGLRDDKVMIQKKIYLEEQLWSLKGEVDDLQKAIYGQSRKDPGGIWLGLQDCRKRLADPRLGGMGKPDAMEKWENITATDESFFYKVDKKTNHLIGVTEEALDDRIARYTTHKRVLEDRYDDMKTKLDACEDKYKSTLVAHGLNPDDTKAQGEWVDGPKGYRVWRMKKAATKDPEELMRRKATKENE